VPRAPELGLRPCLAVPLLERDGKNAPAGHRLSCPLQDVDELLSGHVQQHCVGQHRVVRSAEVVRTDVEQPCLVTGRPQHLDERQGSVGAQAADPTQPNLRQVHLIHVELHAELRELGFDVAPGQMGENILTAGVELLGLPRDTLLQLGEHALVQVTGLRNPCAQIDALRPGLLKAVIGRDQNGDVVRKAGVMAIVVHGGPVRPGGSIQVRLPTGPHHALERV